MSARAQERVVLSPGVRAGTSTDVDVEEQTTTKGALSPPWHVIVHDDPVTLMSYVTLALQKVFGYSLAKSNELMMSVHTTGRAVVWTGERERAEIYVQKLQTWQLRATLELAPV